MDDSALLRQFAQTQSHAAFRDLVERYTNLVYASALTRLHDAHAAQDVTQAVFLTLALKAKDLRPDTSLPGWLFTTTRYVAARYQRGEQRRREREMRAFEKHHVNQPAAPSAAWDELRPHLAGALDSLSGADREAVLLRFYRQASHRQIAEQLRISEDAAEQRVRRALEKLRRLFAKKGVTLSVVALTSALTASASAAPAGLAGVVSGAVLTGAGGTLAATETLMLAQGALTMFALHSAKTAVVAGVCVLLAGTGVYWLATHSSPNPEPVPAAPTVAPRPTVAPSTTADLPPAITGTPLATPARLTPASFEQALQEALREKDTAQRRARLRAILGRLAPADLAWGYDVIAQLGPLKTTPIENKTGNCRACHTSGLPAGNQMNCAVNARLNDAMQALMFRWGELDPRAALARAAQFPDSKLAWYAENSAVEGWIEADPLAAITYIRQNEKQSPIRFAFLDALGAWARKDPQAASRYFDTLTPDERALRASNIGRGWAETDPVAASRWAAGLPDETMRSRAYSAIASTWSRTNPEAAGEWLNSLPAGRDRDIAVSMYSRLLAGATGTAPSGAVDPQTATKWAATITDETIRGEAYSRIAVALTSKEPEAALAWLESLPAGLARDQAAWSASLTAGRENPAAAITWAELIQDEQKRARAYSSVVSWWAGRDRAAATAWANQLPAGPARDAAIAALGKK